MSTAQKNNLIKYLLWLVFGFGILFIKFSYHELWKDEWQAWFVAKDKTIGEILSFLYYEGHPALWYLYLKAFTFLEGSLTAVSLLHIAHWITVVVGSYFLLVRFRLPIIIKALLAASYFLCFEYAVIDRGYFMVVLFFFWAVHLISTPNHSKTNLGIVLLLLCQTEIYGVFMAVGLVIYMYLIDGLDIISTKRKDTVGLFAGMVIFLISFFPRSAGHVAKTQAKELGVFDSILTSFQGNLSNTYLLGSTLDTFTYGWTTLGLLFSVVALAGVVYIFKNDKKLLIVGLYYILVSISFSVLFFLGGIRQWGMGFVFFVGLLELRGLDILKEKIVATIVGVFIIFNIIHNIKAIGKEVDMPFTNAKVTGTFIKEKIPAKVPIVAINKFEATPVVGYAGRKFYELPEGKEFSYFRWVDRIYIPKEGELKLFGKFKGVGGIIILSPNPLDKDRYSGAQLWQSFTEPNYKNENYYLYTLPIK
jgi:hypothetical protein